MIETAQTQLDYTTIMAPSDGRIGMRLVDPGNMVHASDTKPIANLVLDQPCAVLFTLPATNLTDVREALKRGPVEVTAFDQDNRIALSTGKLLLIDNAIDQATATIRLKAMFANDDDVLWPGEFVNARILVETRHNALTVPTAAIQSGPRGLFTWVVTPNNTAEPRPIEVGPATGDLTIVTAGLTDGDRVVTAGQYKLQPKAPVVAELCAACPPARPSQVNLSEPFIRRPVATSLLMAAVAFLGIAAFPLLAGRAVAAGRLPDRAGHARRSPAPAPRPWRPRLQRRSSGSSARSPASPK